MIKIEAGPYELIREETIDADGEPVIRFDKVTLCLMSDNSISQRHYNKYGGLNTQKLHPARQSLDDSLELLLQLTTKFKQENYHESGAAFKPPKAVAQLQMLGKRKANNKLDQPKQNPTKKSDEETKVQQRKRDEKADAK